MDCSQTDTKGVDRIIQHVRTSKVSDIVRAVYLNDLLFENASEKQTLFSRFGFKFGFKYSNLNEVGYASPTSNSHTLLSKCL